MHPRKQLRDAAKAALEAVLPGKIGGLRQYAYSKSALPAIEVSTPSETVERQGVGAVVRQIGLEVRVVFATGTATADTEDGTDAIAADVEATIYGLADGERWIDAILGFSSNLDPGDAAESRSAALVITFTVQVVADEADLETVA